MTSKRGGKIPRPIAKNEWTPRFGNREAARSWDELLNSKLKPALIRFWETVVNDPRSIENPSRHHQLKGSLSTRTQNGVVLEQWQHEISGAGRIWFLIDEDNLTVWVVHVGAGHPSKTE
jgi:hypothetical protein